MGFASGKHAHGFCDRCGWRYPLHDLKAEFEVGVSKNNRVCPECWDEDHPQNFLHLIETDDNISLEDPRPDPALDATRRLYAFDPVLGEYHYELEVTGSVGTVTVVTS